MSEQAPTPDQTLEAIYSFADAQMQAGVKTYKIVGQLVAKGLTPEDAKMVIENLERARSKACRDAGMRNMLFGGLWFVGGSAITLITFAAAANNPGGGRYFLAWGAILFGGIQFVHGLIQIGKT